MASPLARFTVIQVLDFVDLLNTNASVEEKTEPCSLTLGGYDANRFIPHNISFKLNPYKQPEAFLNSISVTSTSSIGNPPNWSSNPLQLLGPADGVYVIIDSSTPFLWLPESTCESFARALGLTYNDSLALYTFDGNASTHDDIQSWNLSFTFSLSDTSNPSPIVNITLPYAAFDLQLTYPYIPNTTYATGNKYYLPLRQAANETQYTIGRAFLQEAYLITDYERNNFSIHQALHPADPIGNTSIVDILKPGTPPSSVSGQATSGVLSKPVIIGIAVGSTALLIALTLIFIYYRHRKRRFSILVEKSPGDDSALDPTAAARKRKHSSSTAPGSQSAFSSSMPLPIFEADGTPAPARLPAKIAADSSHELFEVAGPYCGWPEELDGRSVRSHRVRQQGQGEGQEKFASQIDWERENNSGSKCRPSMRLAVQNRPAPADTASQRPVSVAGQEELRPPTRPPTRGSGQGGGGDNGQYVSERMEKGDGE